MRIDLLFKVGAGLLLLLVPVILYSTMAWWRAYQRERARREQEREQDG